MQIEHRQLSIGQEVWYKYENSQYPADGPFKIKAKYSNYQGEHVTLHNRDGDRDVLLASDDDYGEPIFYDAAPN